MPGDQTVAPLVVEERASAFAELPESVFDALIENLNRESFDAGDVIVREGEAGDRLFVLSEGRADAHALNGRQSVLIKKLVPGDMFGELALLDPDGRHHTTVTATEPIRALSLSREAFTKALADHAFRAAFDDIRESVLRFRLLRLVTLFNGLDDAETSRLSRQITRRAFKAGDILMRQGEPGEFVLLIAAGSVEILKKDEGEQKWVATVGLGALLGEVSILTGDARNATVRAVEDGEAYELARHNLLELLERDRRIGMQAIHLFRLGEQPRQAPGVEVHERQTVDGDTVRVLKRADIGAYFQLSPIGWFIWQKLDGTANLREVTVAYMTAFKTFAPHVVADLIAALTAGGFVSVKKLVIETDNEQRPPGRWRQLGATIQRLIIWHWEIKRGDQLLATLYRGGARLVYTLTGRLVLIALVIAGAASVAFVSPQAMAAIENEGGGNSLLMVLPMLLLSIVLHELGHGLSVKHYGRQVHGVGIGCRGPLFFAFVNTSDMWLENRLPRIVVDLSGIIVNAVLAGFAGLAMLFVDDPGMLGVLWLFAVLSWQIVLVNLNPVFDLDGYHLLSDWLDKPNLRTHGFRRLAEFARTRDAVALKRHRVEITYASLSLVYIAVMGVLIFLVYQPAIAAWLEGSAPAWVSSLVALVLSLLWYVSSGLFLKQSLTQTGLKSSAGTSG